MRYVLYPDSPRPAGASQALPRGAQHRASRHLAVLALLGALTACQADRTAVRLELAFDDSWQLDQLRVAARDRTRSVPLERTLYLRVPDEWGGDTVELAVSGLRGDELVAHATAQVTIVAGQEIATAVTLVPISCPCTVGQTQCQGDAVVTCEATAGQCPAWSEPVACDGATPFCSLGACTDTCVDECADVDTRCTPDGDLQTCGQADSDECRDWLPAEACPGNFTCTGGACVDPCPDSCSPDARRCAGDAVETCEDLDDDGCYQWSAPVACGPDQTCSGGTCASTCTDDCTASACDGNTFVECGQLDSDPCMDAQETSCAATDACFAGACTPDGCTTTPIITCEDPPLDYCVDAKTGRMYEQTGTCSDGACSYPYQDVVCPQLCFEAPIFIICE